MLLDFSRCRLPPFKHQIAGVEKLVSSPIVGLFDTMGLGKTKQIIDAAMFLACAGIIDRVIIICPASVRNVWFDPELGELQKHLWIGVSCLITEYHSKLRKWEWFPQPNPQVRWVITNYDFIRSKDRLAVLLKLCNQKTLLVLDESSAVKSWKALQTQSCKALRQRCGRVALLNGTPIANNPGDLYSQADIMHPTILGCKSYYHFRARYALMGGWQGKVIVGWRDLPDLQNKLKPYVLRRLKEDCIDLPPKLDSVIHTVPLDQPTWKTYKAMRDDMVAWLTETTVSAAQQAIVKAIRLSQITSGFIGGLEQQADFLLEEGEEVPDWMKVEPRETFQPLQFIGQEKINFLLELFAELLEADPHLKLLVWCRFRPEVQRLYEMLSKIPGLKLGRIWGGQKRFEREEAIRLLDPRTMPPEPVVVIGTPASGSMGLNLTGAHTVVYLSNDYSLKTRLQSEDRVHRPGQIHSVSYFDIIASGPEGQKTIDHAIIKALKNKEDIANWTTSAWIQALKEE